MPIKDMNCMEYHHTFLMPIGDTSMTDFKQVEWHDTCINNDLNVKPMSAKFMGNIG
jgi:hypothetical protein